LFKVDVSFLLLFVCLGLAACKVKDPSEDKPQQQKQDVIDARESLLTGHASVSLTVVNDDLTPLSNIPLTIAEQQYTTDNDGQVFIDKLGYGNHAITIQQNGYFTKVGILVNHPNSTTTQIKLHAKPATSKSLVFGGDSMFGRRYLDPSLATMGTTIPNVSDALIRPTTAAADSIAITKDIAPLFKYADFASVNLESPITSNPAVVHPTKEFSFFSLPDSLQGLTEIGIDYVGLGNNHIYDYLQTGLEDTLLEISNTGLLYSGAGLDEFAAFSPITAQLDTFNLVLFAATTVTGKEHELTYVTDAMKGGAADLTNAEYVQETLEKIHPSNFVIAQIHGGEEYTYSPSRFIASHLIDLSTQNTDLLIAHHPHVAQGFAVYNNVPAILGLGNLVFDQARLDTLLGVTVMVELDSQTQTVQRAFAYPIFIEDYKPRFTTGFLSHYLLRRLAEFSDDNITLIPRDNYAEVYFKKAHATKRNHKVSVEVNSQTPILDLREYAPSHAAYLSAIEVTNGTLNELTFGRDLMIFGDFEDWDNDSDAFEISRWDHSSNSVLPCTENPHNGIQALCSTRDEFDNTPSIIPFRHTMSVMKLTDENFQPMLSKQFSLFGYIQSENGGKLESLLTYTTEVDDLAFSQHQVLISEGGDRAWQSFSHDFTLPSDEFTLDQKKQPPRGVKLQFRHYAPNKGEAMTRFDDIAMISWQKSVALQNSQWNTDKMHGYDFLKVSVNDTASLTLTFTSLD
jgi:poly-gamma-glutamate capsule biosynthesis protein CapA/YwtB (metallophosphatase superfamily)